jgi:Aldehyde dehydrogenase family
MNDNGRTRELPALGAEFPKPDASRPEGAPEGAATARETPRGEPREAPRGEPAPDASRDSRASRDGSAAREAPRGDAITAVLPQTRGGTLVAARPLPPSASRLRVQKTYKLFVGGQFIRSESGRYTALADQGGEAPGATENVPRASRKDARDAVRVALGAQPGWAARTAYNRAQIIYRLAEIMEGRMGELTWELARASACPPDVARREVALAIDHVVSAAGWCDKFPSLLGAENPAAGPFLNVSFAEPMGVVAIVAPPLPSLLGLVDAFLPPLVAGNASVVLVSERDPRTALTFGECLATSDLPAGVINLLAGDVAEVAPHLAKHQDVQAFSLCTDDDELARSLEEAAAGSVKRVRRSVPRPAAEARPLGLFDVEAFCETKTVWHPAGP